MTRKNARRIIPLISIAIVVGGTYLAIKIGQGYRPTTDGLSGTGLLATTSLPEGAEVYLNDKLATATDDTINLPPGDYSVTIKKEGYIPWNKTLNVKQELVTPANASLFRSTPSLAPLTVTGASHIYPSPDGTKLAYVLATASATPKNGLYLIELTGNTLSSQKTPEQIARSTGIDFLTAEYLWSPDSTQLLIHTQAEAGIISNYLINIATLNDLDTLPDVTARLPIILSEWEEEIATRETKQFTLLPEELRVIATQSATNVYFSPNDERILYVATASAIIPENLIEPPLVTNTQTQKRELSINHLYVYDLVEDRNYEFEELSLDPAIPTKDFLLLSSYQQPTISAANPTITNLTPPITSYNRLQDPDSISRTFANFQAHYSSLYTMGYQWFPDSTHLLIKLKDKIDLIEYDATNWNTLYSGPFQDDFVYPWPDGTRLVILTNLNPSSDLTPNLYAVDIK